MPIYVSAVGLKINDVVVQSSCRRPAFARMARYSGPATWLASRPTDGAPAPLHFRIRFCVKIRVNAAASNVYRSVVL